MINKYRFNVAEVTESDTNDTKNICEKCDLLYELFSQTPRTNRNYWVFIELFVLLHGGKDYCDISNDGVTESSVNTENHGDNQK